MSTDSNPFIVDDRRCSVSLDSDEEEAVKPTEQAEDNIEEWRNQWIGEVDLPERRSFQPFSVQHF